MIVYLVRHGQTTGDVEERYGGDYDDRLTELGKTQAQIAAEALKHRGIEALYCSPKLRAQETARIIGVELGLVAEIIYDFRERNRYGVLTGLTRQEARSKYPDQFELLADEHTMLDGAEAYEAFHLRIHRALQQVANSGHETVLVVTHGGPIRLIFREFLAKGEIEIDDCATAKIEMSGDTYRLLDMEGIRYRVQ